MRHQKNTVKLGRTSQHRDAMLANMVLSLIEHGRITTTLAKAKAVRPFAEKMITLGKKGTLSHRRLAVAALRYRRPQAVGGKRRRPDLIKKLFDEIAPRFQERQGGYTRIVKLGPRMSDSAPTAIIEWVENFQTSAGQAESELAAASDTATGSEVKAPNPA
jgi:large subunit ribosomal protein L17